MALQPAEQSLARGELPELPLNAPLFQDPLQSGPKHQPGVVDIVTDADPQHPHHLKPKTARRGPAGGAFRPKLPAHSTPGTAVCQTKLDGKSAKLDIPSRPNAKLDI